MATLDDTRNDWNARNPTSPRTFVSWSQRTGVSWHWLGEGKGPSANGPHSACLKRVRDWQAFHQGSTRGWKDIGYNALICQHGRAIEGRGLTYSGSHSPGVNTSHIGIQFMCGDGDPFPSPVMIARAIRLRADIGKLGQNIRRDWGHRDDPKVSTACPGNAIHKWVHSGGPTKRLAGSGSGSSGGPISVPNPTPIPQEDDMPSTDEIVNGLLTADRIPAPNPSKDNPTWTVGAAVEWTLRRSAQTYAIVNELRVTVAGLSAAVESLASSKGADPAAIADEVAKAVKERLAQITVSDDGGTS